MKVLTKREQRAARRMNPTENKQFGIVNYDDGNDYPQRIIQIVNSSPTAKACVETYGKFIGGEGFTDLTFYKAVVNSRGQNVDKILSLIKKDFSRFRGFALHVNLTGGGSVSEVYHVPFEHVRKTSAARKEVDGTDFAIYYDWSKDISKQIKPEEIAYVHAFNPDKTEVIKQASLVDGWDNYKGQLFYFSFDEGSYPLASSDAVLEAILAEIQSDIATTSNIENNFAAKGMLIHKGRFADDEEREEFEEDFDQFVGPEGAKAIVVDVENDEEAPEWVAIEGEVNDKIFEYTDKKVTSKIIRNWLIPKVLLSDTEGTGLFNQEQIRDAITYYNLMTREERLILEDAFRVIFERFETQANPSGDYSVKAIEYELNSDSLPSGMMEILNSTQSTEVKRSALELLFKIAPEDAERLVPKIENSVTNEAEQITKAINSLSPLVANKVLEKMTDDEIRNLVGLKPSDKSETQESTAE